MLGLGQFVGPIQIIEGEDGFIFKWDRTNQKIVVYEAALEAGTISQPTYTGDADVPFFVEEEAVSVAAGGSPDTGTLAYAPAYIVSVADSTGVTYRVIPNDETAVDNVSVQVDFTTGVMTFADADDPAAVRVTYFPSRAGTFFDNANAVEENIVTDDTTPAASTNRAACVQYLYNRTGSAIEKLIPVGEVQGAGEIILNINDSGNTTIESNTAQNGNSIAIRYLNFSALEPGITFVDDTDVAFTTEDIDFSSAGLGQVGTASRDKLIVPGFGNVVVGEETGSGNEIATWGDSGTTVANDVAAWSSKINKWESLNTNAFVTASVPQLEIDFAQLVDPTSTGTVSTPTFTGGGSSALTEVGNGTDLQNVVVDIYAAGR
jgi:hypothetical protein